MSKRYYWLKLKDDFFDKKEIKRLRRMAGGDTYTIIYLKMLLISLKTEGNLYFDDIGDDFVDELSLEIDETFDNTKMTLTYLQSKGLLEIVTNNEYHLNELPSMVGSESESAIKMRRHRISSDNKKEITSHCDQPVIKSDTEIEIEIEKEIEKEIPYVEIINYLNDASGKNYRSTSRKTKDCIKARSNEKFSVGDFKKVIDKKVTEWGGTDMEKFIRPETLFGNKFEGYLNQEKNKATEDDGYDYGF